MFEKQPIPLEMYIYAAALVIFCLSAPFIALDALKLL